MKEVVEKELKDIIMLSTGIPVHFETIFAMSFSVTLMRNQDKIQGSTIAGIEPTYENISSGKYILARPLDLQCNLSTRTEADKKQAIERLRQSELYPGEYLKPIGKELAKKYGSKLLV